jgi:phytanoyl-CoA hydroxylase
MRSELSTDQIEFYRENGYVVIEDFLDTGETEHLRRILTEAVAARGEAVLPKDYFADQTGAEHRAVSGMRSNDDRRQLLSAFYKRRPSWVRMLAQTMNLWQTDERVRQFSLDPRLGRVACELGDLDGVRLWHDQTLVKPPWGDPTGWHLDTPAFAFTHPGTSTFWIALVDTDLRNGCMHYVPGSHKLRLMTTGNWRLDGLRLLNPEWEFVDPVPCPARAGTLVVHNGFTAHGAGANMTPAPRPALSITWLPFGATFNGVQNILPDETYADLQVGDPLEFDTLNPVVYRR